MPLKLDLYKLHKVQDIRRQTALTFTVDVSVKVRQGSIKL